MLLRETLSAGSPWALALEPVPQAYGGDFLETAEETLSMVRAVDHPGLRLHLDIACVMLGGGNIAAAITEGRPWLSHFHAAEPQLGEVEAPRPDHFAAAAALKHEAYGGWVSIEMREAPNWRAAIATARQFVHDVYQHSAPAVRVALPTAID
jgi:sugar phosphate isomerase/epimerase